MTAVSEAMPVYAPEMDAEAFVSVPERLQQLAAAQMRISKERIFHYQPHKSAHQV